MIEVLFGESEAASMKAAKSVVIRRVKEADLIQCFGEEEMALEQLFGTESESGSERFHGGGEAVCRMDRRERPGSGLPWLYVGYRRYKRTCGQSLSKKTDFFHVWAKPVGTG